MYQLVFYVPATHIDCVKQAVFAAGGGHIGNYSDCCWQVLGQGQFRPLKGSHAYLGKVGDIETVAEYRIDVMVSQDHINEVITALISAHPYETPAYHVIKVESF